MAAGVVENADWRATPAGSKGEDDDRPEVKAMATKTIVADVVIDEDELFDLDIALLDGRDDDDHHHHRGHHSSAAPAAAGNGDDDAGGHALLANCLLPLRSVSNAVPVAASSVLLSSYPYSGYYSSSRRLSISGGRNSRRWFLLGRSSAGNNSSVRLCFSSRGFEAMGNYFQRY